MAGVKAFQNEFRPKLINHIIKEIKNGESCALVGMPGVGKTNAIYWLQKRLLSQKPQVLLLRLDINNLISLQDIEFYRLFLLELYQSIYSQLKEDKELCKFAESTYKEFITTSDSLLIFNAIRNILKRLLERKLPKVCILINDFEKTSEMSKTIFNSLLALRTLDKTSIVFLFISTEPLEENVSLQKSAELMNLINYNKHWLNLLNKEEAFKLVDEFTSLLDEKLDDEEKRIVWELSGGHAWYIKVLTKLCVEKIITPKTDFEDIADLNSIKTRAFQIWDTLSDEDKLVLQDVALEKSNDKTKISEFLSESNVLEVKGNDISFFSKLFKHYVKKQALENGYQKDNIVETQGKDKKSTMSLEIKKMRLLKDKVPQATDFTRSEFRLLKYFFENTELAVTRDDVADVLWGKDANAKYSDWAIDKIVSRIREKIEENPRKPEHLLTLRGVGFKFIA